MSTNVADDKAQRMADALVAFGNAKKMASDGRRNKPKMVDYAQKYDVNYNTFAKKARLGVNRTKKSTQKWSRLTEKEEVVVVEQVYAAANFDPSDQNAWRRIANLDETGHQATGGRYMAIGAARERIEAANPTGRENTTVLSTILGSGEALAPLVIFKAKNVHDVWMRKNPLNASVAAQDSGWIDQNIFLDHFKKCIVPGMRRAIGDPSLSGILFLDGHVSHLSLEVTEEAINHNIHVVALPPHCSNALQPLDLAVFAPHKAAWRKGLKEEAERQGLHANVLKANWIEVFTPAFKASHTVANIQAGFRKAGLLPFDRTVIKPEETERGDALQGLSTSNTLAPSGSTAALVGIFNASTPAQRRAVGLEGFGEDEESNRDDGPSSTDDDTAPAPPDFNPAAPAPTPPRPLAPANSFALLAASHPELVPSESPVTRACHVLSRAPSNLRSRHRTRQDLVERLEEAYDALRTVSDTADESAAQEAIQHMQVSKIEVAARVAKERTSRAKERDIVLRGLGYVVTDEARIAAIKADDEKKQKEREDVQRRKDEREANKAKKAEEGAKKVADKAAAKVAKAAAKAASAPSKAHKTTSTSTAGQAARAPFGDITNSTAAGHEQHSTAPPHLPAFSPPSSFAGLPTPVHPTTTPRHDGLSDLQAPAWAAPAPFTFPCPQQDPSQFSTDRRFYDDEYTQYNPTTGYNAPVKHLLVARIKVDIDRKVKGKTTAATAKVHHEGVPGVIRFLADIPALAPFHQGNEVEKAVRLEPAADVDAHLTRHLRWGYQVDTVGTKWRDFKLSKEKAEVLDMPPLKLWWAILMLDQAANHENPGIALRLKSVVLANWVFNAVLGKLIPAKAKLHQGGASQKLISEHVQELCLVTPEVIEVEQDHSFFVTLRKIWPLQLEEDHWFEANLMALRPQRKRGMRG
ncbi:hypothetical protein JCM1840_002372 [Sporobolomyces johnsonii]